MPGTQPPTIDELNQMDRPEPPKVRRGTRVRFWPNGNMRAEQELLGFVHMVESPHSVHIAVFADEEWLLRESCLHRGDPMIPYARERFADNSSGVWDLAEEEIEQRVLAERIKKLEDLVTVLQMRTSARRIEEPTTPPGPAEAEQKAPIEPPKRGRGRPPKEPSQPPTEPMRASG